MRRFRTFTTGATSSCHRPSASGPGRWPPRPSRSWWTLGWPEPSRPQTQPSTRSDACSWALWPPSCRPVCCPPSGSTGCAAGGLTTPHTTHNTWSVIPRVSTTERPLAAGTGTSALGPGSSNRGQRPGTRGGPALRTGSGQVAAAGLGPFTMGITLPAQELDDLGVDGGLQELAQRRRGRPPPARRPRSHKRRFEVLDRGDPF